MDRILITTIALCGVAVIVFSIISMFQAPQVCK